VIILPRQQRRQGLCGHGENGSYPLLSLIDAIDSAELDQEVPLVGPGVDKKMGRAGTPGFEKNFLVREKERALRIVEF
jgi:hypothetical protein